jgi:anti-anti-sigma factor
MPEPATKSARPARVSVRGGARPQAASFRRAGSQPVPDQPGSGYPAAGPFPGTDVSWRGDDRFLVATISGALDAVRAPALREHLLHLAHNSAGRLVVDLSAVSDADVSGLTVLMGTARRARLLGGGLRLAEPSAPVTEILRHTGLDRQFDIYPSVEAAVRGPAAA